LVAQKQAGKRSILSLGLNEASFVSQYKEASVFSVESSELAQNETISGVLIAIYKVKSFFLHQRIHAYCISVHQGVYASFDQDYVN